MTSNVVLLDVSVHRNFLNMTSNVVLLDVNVHLKKLNKYIYNKRMIVIMITIKSCDKVCRGL